MTPEDAAQATESAWHDHHTSVLEHLRRLSRDPHLAEDLAAETFVRLLRFCSVAENEEPKHLRAWLKTVARNLLTDHHRSASASRETLTFDPFSQLDEPTVDEAHVSLETWESVLSVLELLPEHQRMVVVLRGLLDMSSADTAEVMGISNQAVRTLKFEAKKRLVAERHRVVSVLEPQPEPPLESPTEPDSPKSKRTEEVNDPSAPPPLASVTPLRRPA